MQEQDALSESGWGVRKDVSGKCHRNNTGRCWRLRVKTGGKSSRLGKEISREGKPHPQQGYVEGELPKKFGGQTVLSSISPGQPHQRNGLDSRLAFKRAPSNRIRLTSIGN